MRAVGTFTARRVPSRSSRCTCMLPGLPPSRPTSAGKPSGRGHDEVTAAFLAVVTVFLDRHPHQFREQGRGQATDLRMAWDHGCQGTAISLDDVGAVMPFEFCQAAQFIQYFDGSFEPRTHFPWWDRPQCRETTTGRLHERFHLLGGQALVQRLQELAQYRA